MVESLLMHQHQEMLQKHKKALEGLNEASPYNSISPASKQEEDYFKS
jgi:hypothetical protein